MTPSGSGDAARGRVALTWPEIGVLVAFALATTGIARSVWPTWDEGWVELVHSTGGTLKGVMGDRPAYGTILTWLHQNGVFWRAHQVMHFVGWFAQGFAAAAIWSLCFPTLRRWRLVAGCLAIAPVICQFQLVLAGGMYLVQVAVVYASFLCIYYSFTRTGGLWWKAIVLVAVAGAVFATSLISEYTVPASVVAAVLLWFLLGRDQVPLRARVLGSALLPAFAFAGYFVYYLTVDASVRADVRPEKIIFGAPSLIGLAATAFTNLLNELWQLCFGRTLSSLGAVRLDPTAEAVEVLGIAIAGTLAIAGASLRLRDQKETEDPPTHGGWRWAGVFLLATVLGLLPVVLLGRSALLYQMETRYWLPILPVAACITVLLIRMLSRDRFTPVIVIVLAFVSAYTITANASQEQKEADATEVWGAALHGRLTPEGMNVAYFVYEAPDIKRAYVIERSYELTARLTRHWPIADRNRFWAWAAPLSGNETPNPPPYLGVTIRATLRAGPVAKFLWVSVDENGQVRRLLERSPAADHWSPAR